MKPKNSITAIALKRPVTTLMAFVSMLLLGLVSARLLPLEMFPGIEIPRVFINAPYQGSSPAETERQVTKVLEEALATMGGIQEMRSNSNEDGAFINISLKWGESIANKSLEAREKIDEVRHLLPPDLERVFVQQFSTDDMSILTLRLSSQRELSNAYDLLDKQLKRPLERVQGVSKVELYGTNKRQVEIRLDADRLAASGMSLAQLQSQLKQQNFVMNAGRIRQPQQVLHLSPQGEFQNLDEIRSLVIKPGLTLGDIATVNFFLPENRERRHLDGNYAVGLNIFKESGANLVDVSERVLAVVEQVKNNPQFNGIKLFVMEDQAKSVKSSLKDLTLAGLLGAAMSFVVLLLFLRNLKMTLVVVVSVPVSIAITLGAMYLLGYTLNILSMMGLLLAIGMLIDNAVVITESVLQEQQKGSDNAILKGVDSVSLAVLAGTLTTAIVFLPNIFGTKNELTVFLEHVAISICISLAASLLVAKTLLPLMLRKFNVTAKPKQSNGWLQKGYSKSLGWCLAHPKWSLLLALIMLGSTAIPFSQVKQDETDNNEKVRLFISYNVEGRHSMAVTEALVNEMEAYLFANKEEFGFESVYSFYAPWRAESTLIYPEKHDLNMKEIKRKIREGFPKFSIAKPQFGWSGNDNSGIRVSLTGRSTSQLIENAEQIVPMIEALPGFTDVRSEADSEQSELVIQFKRDHINRLGLNTTDISQAIQTALRGTALRSYRHDASGELRMELSYDHQWRNDLELLKTLPVARIGNRILPLDSVADLKVQPRLQNIRHLNRQTSLTIGANLEEGVTMEDARKSLQTLMQQLSFDEGYGYRMGGGFQRQDEEQQVMLINMVLAIAMIYIVMAALFESLLLPTAIITSILFSITGVFWALWLSGTAMSVMAMIGILVLLGIVVNNGIVLVDQINQLSPSQSQLSDVIRQVCLTRIRPVMMTVATTVLGLLPLAMGDTQIGGGGPPYAPMAIAIIGGLLFSTLTSLYLVPLCYQALVRMRYRSAVQLGRSYRLTNRLLPWTR
ncbi:efflux RND transporter permease subunit [Paraferrimonas haliotis]|uniref:Acriflavin resistance protein n=1 Tax=Paraferrimonas haliotis TaxID=2013866 RepID=A0AA37TR98_9GAMM|nr:efflux RND transporter permease subunit [Paraferrimonas haliotis]GLS84173.1 acriflavin resistance protein [Paraferrimonas haliotis]